MDMKKLYKTTIVIWSEYDPEDSDIEILVCEATNGDCYCSAQKSELVKNPEKDPDWDDNEFFDGDEEDDDDDD
jgi:hypothetical protein